MEIIDVFKQDPFSMVSLTAGVDKAPFQPQRLGAMGLFQTEPTTQIYAAVEEQHGTLQLIPTAARGVMPNQRRSDNRRMRVFAIPHIPHNDELMADDLQGVRAFGKEKMMETLSQMTSKKLRKLRQDHEVTWEWHRIGALKGQVLDADGSSVIYNWFTEFGITQDNHNFDFTTANQVKLHAHAIKRNIEDALGASVYTGIHAFCGESFFDSLTTCTEVKDAYARWRDGERLREGQARTAFEYAGITWEEYRGSIGGTKFVADGAAHFFPLGTRDVFQRANAPGTFIETANTMGKPIYVKQEPKPFNTGINFHSQSNPLHLVTRPKVLQLGTEV